MERIRLWAFPVALIAAWILAAAYTLSLLIQDPRVGSPEREPAEMVRSGEEPV